MLYFDDIPATKQTATQTGMTLTELNGMVRDLISCAMPDNYWVEAELAGVHESRGHCYMELVEKDERSNTPVAQARACCWKNTWLRLRPRFESVTGQPLHAGMKVLLKVKATFHEAYGFSWTVNDIDPTFTIGDMARRREEILRTLREEGVIDLNKQLTISPFAKRIAVISSSGAAGYGDFCKQLINNGYGFQFAARLFPATMQGEDVERSVIAALDAINAEAEHFDVVVIIRGGGSTADLSGFDTLALAENVANFPLPIITGIGHDRDQSVLDIIACKSVKTPTAAAAFLIDNLATTLDFLDDASQRIVRAVKDRMQAEEMRLARIEQFLTSFFAIRKVKAEAQLNDYAARMAMAVRERLSKERLRLDAVQQRLPLIVRSRTEKEDHLLQLLQQRVAAVDPINILRRGYSITLHDGMAVTSPKDISKGDHITVLVADGEFDAIVK